MNQMELTATCVLVGVGTQETTNKDGKQVTYYQLAFAQGGNVGKFNVDYAIYTKVMNNLYQPHVLKLRFIMSSNYGNNLRVEDCNLVESNGKNK